MRSEKQIRTGLILAYRHANMRKQRRKITMNKDTGNWLSAEQAVLPDGTEVGNLPLINKKLPALAPTAAVHDEKMPAKLAVPE